MIVLTSEDKSAKIASYDSGSVKAGDLFADRKKSPTTKFEFFKRFESISQQHLFAKHAIELDLQNNPDLADQLNDMKTSLLRTILYQRKVKDKVQEALSSDSGSEIYGSG